MIILGNSLSTLLPVLCSLPRADKSRVVQVLIDDLAREEGLGMIRELKKEEESQGCPDREEMGNGTS
jgi:hypothetical protein